MLPTEPAILLSYLNMKLRDEYPDLDELCSALDEDRDELAAKMEKAGYFYDREQNCFRKLLFTPHPHTIRNPPA